MSSVKQNLLLVHLCQQSVYIWSAMKNTLFYYFIHIYYGNKLPTLIIYNISRMMHSIWFRNVLLTGHEKKGKPRAARHSEIIRYFIPWMLWNVSWRCYCFYLICKRDIHRRKDCIWLHNIFIHGYYYIIEKIIQNHAGCQFRGVYITSMCLIMLIRNQFLFL